MVHLVVVENEKRVWWKGYSDPMQALNTHAVAVEHGLFSQVVALEGKQVFRVAAGRAQGFDSIPGSIDIPVAV